MRRPAACVGLCLLGASALIASGCAVSPRVAEAPRAGAPGAALFLPGDLAAGDLGYDGFEYARRDGEMSIASHEPITAGDEWPAPAAPSLANRRSATLQTRSFGEIVVFFEPEGRGGHSYRPGHHARHLFRHPRR
ncbi:MAG: hypothetical protein AB7K52_08080 [Phycisphaerales bacterium]